MVRMRMRLFLLGVAALLMSPVVPAMGQDLPAENHYKAYYIQPQAIITNPLTLHDQFGVIELSAPSPHIPVAVFKRFANPAEEYFPSWIPIGT